jgi:NAD+ kinase
MSVHEASSTSTCIRTLLFGAESSDLLASVAQHAKLDLVEENPDLVICYGGDGTLLTAERKWPGVPKAPIRNSRRGKRMIGRPPDEVIARIAAGNLHRNEYIKLSCTLTSKKRDTMFTAMNEFNVHMATVNSAVRFNITFDDEPYDSGRELLGDGFVVCTPFGSTAYFKQITRGILYSGLGIGFKFPSDQLNHIVVPDATTIRARILRGPAVLAFDNAPEYVRIEQGDELLIHKHLQPAIILTWDAMRFQCDAF